MTSSRKPCLGNIGLVLTGAAVLISAQPGIAEEKTGIPPPPSPIEKAIPSLKELAKFKERRWDRPDYDAPDLVPVVTSTDPCWIQLQVSNISNQGVPEDQLNASKLWFEISYDDGRFFGDHVWLHDLPGHANLLRGFSSTGPFRWPLLPGESATFVIHVDSNLAVEPEVNNDNNAIETGASCPET